MRLQRYKIVNLLNYQVEQVKKILDEDNLTVISNKNQPHFYNIYIGLNPTEISILTQLGFSLNKYVAIGEY